MSFAFGSVFACFFSHFHQLMITDSGDFYFVENINYIFSN